MECLLFIKIRAYLYTYKGMMSSFFFLIVIDKEIYFWAVINQYILTCWWCDDWLGWVLLLLLCCVVYLMYLAGLVITDQGASCVVVTYHYRPRSYNIFKIPQCMSTKPGFGSLNNAMRGEILTMYIKYNDQWTISHHKLPEKYLIISRCHAWSVKGRRYYHLT